MNTATCVNTVNKYADAVFLVDNERFRKTESSLVENLRYINGEIVKSFYDLWCAGEERNPKYVGSKVIDAGDIIQSLNGITSIGRGEVGLSIFSRWKRGHFRQGVKERGSANGALRQAENNLSLGIEMQDARKTLTLISGPKEVLNLAMLEEISGFLQDKAPQAIIRIGDYPRRRHEIAVTVVISQLTYVTRLENLFTKAEELFSRQQDISRETMMRIEKLQESARNIPILD